MSQVRSSFHALTTDECLRLLAHNRVGRLALTDGALPCVLPVQYEQRGRALLLRTPGHHRVGPGIEGQVVGFETDDLDLDHGDGWCVAVIGTVHVLPAPSTVDPVHRWFRDGVVLTLDAVMVSGHRVAT